MSVGDGNSIRIWDDPWIPDLQGFIPKPKNGVNPDEILLVSQLLNSDHNALDIHKLKHWFEDSEVELILKIPLSSCVVEDKWTWTPTSSGDLTVKSAYWNQVLFENIHFSIDDLYANIGRLLAEFKNSRPVEVVPVGPKERLHDWSPPRRFLIKINVDAAIGPKFSAVAVMARDWRGKLVFACSQKVNTIFPLQAEAYAMKWALLLAAKLEFEGIYIESDSKICCDALTISSQASPWRIRSIVLEMQISQCGCPLSSKVVIVL
ncbi:uncharacterized protein LOC136071171 [Quercus suber]|uniref:uncharacterized protein LOC136071171 n=1 Tax=Quercus suber TaxID=58331 RepID=UPI0032E01794